MSNMLDEIQNWQRRRALAQSGAVKALFNENGQLKRDGEALLADLREYCFAQKSTFDADALVMAKREGRREVWLRITKFLNLDERTVQLLMEIDDGIGE